MRRIGVFGGTFNPIHTAHILIANTALSQLDLDFVIMMTGGNPPHKSGENIPDAKLRHIMLKLAVAEHEGLIPCDYEVKRLEYSYTANTLKFLKKIYPNDELYFIMGGDSIDYFDEWYKPDEIARMARLAVYSRGNMHRIDEMRKRFNADITLLNGENIDISSTDIRNFEGEIIDKVPDKVAEFIEKFGIYKNRPELETLEKMLDEDRFKHSIGVSELAGTLAERYGVDRQIATECGMLHDVAKCIPYEEALTMCDELEAEVDPVERHMPPLIHAKLGAELVKCLFGIKEGEITSAIRSHTVGRLNMSILDKIIFVADMCEEGKSFSGVDKIRERAFDSIDEAVVMCIDSSIEFNRKKGNTVHPMAYAVRKELLSNLEKNVWTKA